MKDYLERRSSLLIPFSAAAAFVMAHGLCIFLWPAHAAAVSYPFVILAPLLAFAGCCRQVRLCLPKDRFHWALIAAGLLLWAAGMTIEAWEETIRHVSPALASLSDFCLFIYGVPILLSISRPNRRYSLSLFAWLDGIEASVITYLIYIAFFSVSPFAHKAIHPIGVNTLILVYSIEALVLAAGATLRFLTHGQDESTCHFYGVLSRYLWAYFVCSGLLNYSYLVHKGVTGYYDLLIDMPFLYLAIMASRPTTHPVEAAPAMDRRPLAAFVENISPVFFTAALFSLSFVVLQHHLRAGIVSMVVALAVYAIRTTTLQSRFIRTQQELLETQERLEQISLTDELTGVANRRCFDRTLDDEWDRAVRTRQNLSLLMIDVDFFKILNDRHGHRHGDSCLQKMAEAMHNSLPRSGDLLARYGGEEFVILLPTTDDIGAEAVGARMQAAVEALQIKIEAPTGSVVTISIGYAVATFPTEKTSDDLIESADRALYLAKQNGRNRIESQPLIAISA